MKNLESIGFRRGRSATTTFVHDDTGVRLVVWGDDFTFLGRAEDLKAVLKRLEQWYEVKLRAVLGPEPTDDKEVRILNRTLRWNAGRITYEGDDKHANAVISGMGLSSNSKGLDVALGKEDSGEDESEELGIDGAKRYRRLAAVVNFMSLDRPDLQFAASVLGRSMSKPTIMAEMKLKKVVRYLLAHPCATYHYEPGRVGATIQLVAWSDSDWAGCRVSRRSTSGGLLSIDGGLSNLGRIGKVRLLFPVERRSSTRRGRPRWKP